MAPDTHLSGSTAEIWSSCPHPRTPEAQCPAHLQERAQEQVRNPPSLGHTRGTQLCDASQEVWDCQHFWGISGKASSTHPGASGVWGAEPPPSPTGTPGTNPSHPQAVLGPLYSPAASALKAIQRQLAFTWFPQEVTEPARIPLIQAWHGEGKTMSGAAWLWQGLEHSMARDPQPQRSCHADGELETGDSSGIILSSGVSQDNVAVHTPVTKHSPSLG